jgi:hypothetical protein
MTTYDDMIEETRVLVFDTERDTIKIGHNLIALKDGLPHGEWLPALERIGINDRSAQRYMQRARDPEAHEKTKAADRARRPAQNKSAGPSHLASTNESSLATADDECEEREDLREQMVRLVDGMTRKELCKLLATLPTLFPHMVAKRAATGLEDLIGESAAATTQ